MNNRNEILKEFEEEFKAIGNESATAVFTMFNNGKFVYTLTRNIEDGEWVKTQIGFRPKDEFMELKEGLKFMQALPAEYKASALIKAIKDGFIIPYTLESKAYKKYFCDMEMENVQERETLIQIPA